MKMLVLSTLHKVLSQVLSLPDLHTAILLTTEGKLVSFASDPTRCRDDVLVAVGLSGAVWHETREQRYGMVDSELGRILVLPVEENEDDGPRPHDRRPLMLLALNSTEAVEWDELQVKGRALVSHLATDLSQFREHLTVKSTKSSHSNLPSPNRLRQTP